MSLHVLPLCVWVLSGFLPQSKLRTEVHFKIANVKKLKKNLESTSDLMKKIMLVVCTAMDWVMC